MGQSHGVKMPSVSCVEQLITDIGETSVDRGIAEFRAGRPILIEDDGVAILALGVEALDADLTARLEASAAGLARLALPAPRLRRLGVDRTSAGVIALPRVDAERILTLAFKTGARIDAPVAIAHPIDEAALELARLALVLPAAIIIPVDAGSAATDRFVRVAAGAIARYRQTRVRDIRIVGRAPVPLEGAPETEFVIFRGGEGFRDQVAIVIGTPRRDEPVPVRLHSACLTGDLFGSLKCDCGDQLRDTVRHMAGNGGGIVLYLDQEGRGNGIANKMRAYKLQSMGFDTYDADEILGFGLDQRRFDFAAAMLRQLGIGRVMLMTNNPEKIVALNRAGIEVVAARRVFGRATVENQLYLEAKRDRAGHFIDFETSAARAPLHD